MNFLKRTYPSNYTILKPKDYKSGSINDEIVEEFNRRKIVVQDIRPLDAYSVIGCKVRTNNQCKELQDYFNNL